MKTFKELLIAKGINCSEAAKASGVPYPTVRAHFYGKRKVSANHALIYDKKLNISKHELCPHLWPPVLCSCDEVNTNAT